VIGRGREIKLEFPVATANKVREPKALIDGFPNMINSLAPELPEIKSCSPNIALNETTINPVSVVAAPV
jgi:hypothetical protein